MLSGMSCANRVVLWMVFARPYFYYVLPVVKLQLPTFQNRFTTAMRNSFRKFLSLPKSTPRRIMEKLFEEGKILMERQFRSVNNKIIQRFLGQEPIDQEENGRVEDYVGIAELLPINFNQLFIYAGKKCTLHNKHLKWIRFLYTLIFRILSNGWINYAQEMK